MKVMLILTMICEIIFFLLQYYIVINLCTIGVLKMKVKMNFGSTCINLNNVCKKKLVSFAVMSFYKYISKRLYDHSFILYIQIINNMEMSSAMPNDQKNI